MKKAIVGSTLAIALLVGGCAGGGDSANKSPGIPNGQVINREEPKEVKQEVVYIPKDVSEMSKEERYKKIAKIAEEANQFYIEVARNKENKSKDWFEKKGQEFLLNYLHKFHVLAAKELAESKINEGLNIPESKSGKPVWYFEASLRNMTNRILEGEPRYVGGYGQVQYKSQIDAFKKEIEE